MTTPQIKDIRKANLQRLIDGPPYYGNQAEFAKASGLSKGRISQLLDPEQQFGDTASVRLAEKMGLPPGFFDRELKPKVIQNSANIVKGPFSVRMVPLLTKEAAGMFKEIIDGGWGGFEGVPNVGPDKEYTFAMRVEGDSMEPEYTHGTIIIVETDENPVPNDFVIVVMADGAATFRQLIKEDGELMLKPLNPRYGIKPLGDAKVIGIAKRSMKDIPGGQR